MFGIGWGELLIIGVVGLVVVGPEKLPEIARFAGKVYSQARRFTEETSQDLATEVERIKKQTMVEELARPSIDPYPPGWLGDKPATVSVQGLKPPERQVGSDNQA